MGRKRERDGNGTGTGRERDGNGTAHQIMKIAFTLSKLRIAKNCNSSLILEILETPPPPTSVSHIKSLPAAPLIDVGARFFQDTWVLWFNRLYYNLGPK